MQVWIDDRLVADDEARVSVFDRGFRTGEGVFETLRAYDGEPFRLADHLDRAAAGAARLGFELPERERLIAAVRATAEANTSHGDLAVRLTVTPGPIDPGSPFPGRPTGRPTLVVTAHALRIDPATYADGVRAVRVERTRELPSVKAVSYLTASLAHREASDRGAAEALLATSAGEILEGSFSNVFAVIGGGLVTPPTSAGILPGVTRAIVIELAVKLAIGVEERRLFTADVDAADEVFLTATTREIVPVTRIDNDLVGTGRPGPVSRLLLEAYRAEVRRETAS